MSQITNVDLISRGLSNQINWTGIWNNSVTIKRYLPGNNNSFNQNPVIITPDDYPFSSGEFKDYDIRMNQSYRYEVVIGSNIPTLSAYCISFNGLINGGSVNYDYENSQFNLNWTDTSIVNNLDQFSQYTYDIFVAAHPKPSEWSSSILHFNNISSSSNTFTIKNNITKDINQQEIKIILNTKYTFFITPSYVFGGTNFQAPPTITTEDGIKRTYYPDDINTQTINNYTTDRLPPEVGNISLFQEPPTNFSIKNPYSNNKISFSWDNINNSNIFNYKITLIKNNSIILTTSINNNSYTLDNSNFTYRPGIYTIQISANYYGLETEKTSLNFTIPVTPISLTIKPLNNLGQLTNDYKNISSIQVNWNGFSYATYYKIKVKIVDKDGNSQQDLCFYTTNTNYTFPIDSNLQVELKFSVSYSVDSYSPSSDNWPYGPQSIFPIMTIEAMTNDGFVANGSQTSDSYLDLKFTSTQLTSTFESEDIVLSNNVPAQYTTSSNYIPQNGITSMIYVFKVTVQEVDGNNYFCINGIKNPELKVYWNRYFIFDQSDSSNEGHPFSVKIYNPAESGFGDRGSYHGTPGSENSFWIFSQSETPGGTYVYDTENNYSGEGVWKSRISTDNLMGNNIRVSGDPVMQGGNPIYTSDDITPTNVFRQQLRTTQAGTYTIDINANSFKSTTGLDNTASTQFSWTRNQ